MAGSGTTRSTAVPSRPYKLAFTFPTDAGLLEYLRGRVFTVEQVDFVAEYFPTGERV